jgi:hypothetical protein
VLSDCKFKISFFLQQDRISEKFCLDSEKERFLLRIVRGRNLEARDHVETTIVTHFERSSFGKKRRRGRESQVESDVELKLGESARQD